MLARGKRDGGFDGGVFFLTLAAAEQRPPLETLSHRRRRKFNLQNSISGSLSGDTINVAARVFAKMANEADFGFAAGTGDTHSEGFVRSKLVAGEHAGAKPA